MHTYMGNKGPTKHQIKNSALEFLCKSGFADILNLCMRGRGWYVHVGDGESQNGSHGSGESGGYELSDVCAGN